MAVRAGLLKIDIKSIKEKWLELQKTPSIFAYNLNIQNQKYLDGNYYFFAEYNPERSSLRRPPQAISGFNPPYDENKFNFNKIHPMEHIASVPYNGKEVSLIINKSPLTKYHTLICPDLTAGLCQRVTLDVLRFSTAFLQQLEDKAFRIGYNSPGALASVNHLHFHLIYVDTVIYLDHAKLELLSKEYIFRLSKDMPTQGLCWLIYKHDSETEVHKKLKEIYDFIMYACSQNRPHNIFMTHDRGGEATMDGIKIFVFLRENYCTIKDLLSLNIGFCEFSGYVPVGDLHVYESLTEEVVLSKIRAETGNVYNEVHSYFENIQSN